MSLVPTDLLLVLEEGRVCVDELLLGRRIRQLEHGDSVDGRHRGSRIGAVRKYVCVSVSCGWLGGAFVDLLLWKLVCLLVQTSHLQRLMTTGALPFMCLDREDGNPAARLPTDRLVLSSSPSN